MAEERILEFTSVFEAKQAQEVTREEVLPEIRRLACALEFLIEEQDFRSIIEGNFQPTINALADIERKINSESPGHDQDNELPIVEPDELADAKSPSTRSSVSKQPPLLSNQSVPLMSTSKSETSGVRRVLTQWRASTTKKELYQKFNKAHRKKKSLTDMVVANELTLEEIENARKTREVSFAGQDVASGGQKAFESSLSHFVEPNVLAKTKRALSQRWKELDIAMADGTWEESHTPNEVEQQQYTRLCCFLELEVVKAQRATAAKYGGKKKAEEIDVKALDDPNLTWIYRCVNLLAMLRALEEQPMPWRGGFFHTIDNFLSILLYLRTAAPPPPPAKEKVLTKAEREDYMKYFFDLEARFFHASRTKRVKFFCALMLSIVCLGIAGISSSWWITADQNLSEGAKSLVSEYEIRLTRQTQLFARDPALFTEMFSGSVVPTDFGGNITSLLGLMVDGILLYALDGIHITLPSGHFAGVYRTDAYRSTAAGRAPTGNQELSQVRAIISKDGAAYEQCQFVNSSGVTTNCASVAITTNATSQYWYTFAKGKYGANWTGFYSMLTPGNAAANIALPGASLSGVAATTLPNRLGLTLASPLFRSGVMQGVLGVDVCSSRLAGQLRVVKYWRNSLSYVANSNWTVIGSSPGVVDIDRRLSDASSIEVVPSSNDLVRKTVSYFRENYPPTATGQFSERIYTDWFNAPDEEVAGVASDVVARHTEVIDNVLTAAFAVRVSPGQTFALIIGVDREDYFGPVRDSLLATVALAIFAILASFGIMLASYKIAGLVEVEISRKRQQERDEELQYRKTRSLLEVGLGSQGASVRHLMKQAQRKMKQRHKRFTSTDSDHGHYQHGRTVSSDEAAAVELTSYSTDASAMSPQSVTSPGSVGSSSSNAPTSTIGLPSRSSSEQADEKQGTTVAPLGRDNTLTRMATAVVRQRDKERANRIVISLLLVILFLLMGIWFTWTGQESAQVDEISDQILFRSQDRMFSSVRFVMNDAVSTDDVIKRKEMREDGLPGLGGAGDPLDRFFFKLMKSIRQTGAPLSAPLGVLPDGYAKNPNNVNVNNSLQSVVSYAYVGFADGSFIGSQLWQEAVGVGGEFLIGARDASNGNCYKKYQAKTAAQMANTVHTALSGPGSVDYIRDTSQEVFSSLGCSFDPRTRPWYVNALNTSVNPAQGMVWSAIYEFASPTIGRVVDPTAENELGLTASIPLFYANGTLLGVVGVDVELRLISQLMNLTTFQSTDNATMFIIDRSDLMIATGNTESPTQRGRQYLATSSQNVGVQNTANFLSNTYEGGLASIQNGADGAPTRVTRKFEAPVTAVYVLDGGLGLDWLVVLGLPLEGFLQAIDDRETRSFIICLGTTVAVLYIIVNSYSTFQRKVFDAESGRSKKSLLDRIASGSGELQYLKTYMERIRHIVIQACAHKWYLKKLKNGMGENTPVRMAQLRDHYREEAIKHIHNAQEDRNILTICRLTLGAENDGSFDLSLKGPPPPRRASSGRALLGPGSDRELEAAARRREEAMKWRQDSFKLRKMGHNDSRRRLAVYYLHTSLVYRLFYNIVVCAHIGLVFLEPDTYEEMRENGTAVGVLVAEGICLFFEFLDVAMDMTIKHRWETENPLRGRHTHLLDFAYVLIIVLVFFDWIFALSLKWSFEYLFPLRPIILVLKNTPIRDAAWNFARTIAAARHVLLLYFFTVMIASAMGVILFRRILRANGPQSSYTNFVRAVTTTFTFVSTGENYTEVVYPTFRVSPWYILFWLVFLVVGMFFVLAMVIGLFQHGFQELRNRKRRKRKMFHRTGIVAAFILLDLDASHTLDADEFTGFLTSIRKQMAPDVAREIFETLNSDHDGAIDIQEFVRGIETLTLHRLFVQKDTKIARWRIALQLLVFERSWFKHWRLLLLMTNIWVAALYGVYDQENLLDVAMAVFIIMYTIELALRVTAYGLHEFWHYSLYHAGRDGEYEQYSNRFDMVVILVSITAFTVSRIAVGSFTFTDGENSLRFVLTFPLIRIVGVLKKTRELVFTLIKLLPQFASIGVVMLVVFFGYAVIGVWMLSGKFKAILNADERPEGDFDSTANGLLTLLQLLVGEGWHEVMYAAVRATHGFAVSWYFVSFVIVVTLLFTNVFIGLVLDAFQNLVQERRLDEHTAEAEKRAEALRAKMTGSNRAALLEAKSAAEWQRMQEEEEEKKRQDTKRASLVSQPIREEEESRSGSGSDSGSPSRSRASDVEDENSQLVSSPVNVPHAEEAAPQLPPADD